jgi:hypothetical protein
LSLSPYRLTMSTGLRLPLSGCSRPHCHRVPATTLEKKLLCQKHFITGCYARLDEIAEQIKRKKLLGCCPESIRNFLAECTSQTAAQALRACELSNQERAQLLCILLLIGELLNLMRRSPRMERAVPVRLLSGRSGGTWIEETVTQVLSKYGAMFRCAHPYAKGDTLEFVRLDTGLKAFARVVWQEPERSGQHRVAIEILNHTNFWDWSI